MDANQEQAPNAEAAKAPEAKTKAKARSNQNKKFSKKNSETLDRKVCVDIDSLSKRLSGTCYQVSFMTRTIPITTRGVGFIAQFVYDRIRSVVPANQAPNFSALGLYRIVLTAVQYRIQLALERGFDKPYNANGFSRHAMDPIPQAWIPRLQSIGRLPAPLAYLVNSVGRAKVDKQEYFGLIPPFDSVSGTTHYHPWCLTITNLREALNGYALLPAGEREIFRNHVAIPSLDIDDNVVNNVNAIIPAGYVPRDDICNWHDAMLLYEKKAPAALVKVDWTGEGSEAMLCNQPAQDLAAVALPEFPDQYYSYSICPINEVNLLSGGSFLLGEYMDPTIPGFDWRRWACRSGSPVDQMQLVSWDDCIRAQLGRQ